MIRTKRGSFVKVSSIDKRDRVLVGTMPYDGHKIDVYRFEVNDPRWPKYGFYAEVTDPDGETGKVSNRGVMGFSDQTEAIQSAKGYIYSLKENK